MPYLIRDRLFLGNINAAIDVLRPTATTITSSSSFCSTEFTHVLSLLSSASISALFPALSIPTRELRRVHADAAEQQERLLYVVERAGPELRLTRMALQINDVEEADLLGVLEACLDFIDEGRKEGAVLVHCLAGISRSSSVVTAYIMRTEHKTVEDALKSVRECCEFIRPNDGFLAQLKLFEEMGFQVDTASLLYKDFMLRKNADSSMRQSSIRRSFF